MIASVDPGIHGSGLAIFDQDKLVFATYVPNLENGRLKIQSRVSNMGVLLHDAIVNYSLLVNTVVTECPQIYPGRTAKGSDPTNDLIPLAQIGAVVAGNLPRLYWEQVYPREWKGQVEKKAMNDRIMERLSDEEKDSIQWPPQKDLCHNVKDAIGIGLWYLDRLGKVRVVSRG